MLQNRENSAATLFSIWSKPFHFVVLGKITDMTFLSLEKLEFIYL